MKDGAALTFVSDSGGFGQIQAHLRENQKTEEIALECGRNVGEVFRYRVNSVLEGITKKQVREARKIGIR